MFEYRLVKGDNSNLKGFVIAYAKFLKDLEVLVNLEGEMVPRKMKRGDMMGLATPRGLRKGVIEDIVKDHEHYPIDIKIKLDMKKISPVYIKGEMESYILRQDWDAVFTGFHENVPQCIKSIETGLECYLVDLESQIVEECRELLKAHIIETKEEKERKRDSYSNYFGDEIKDRIISAYIIPMFKAWEFGEYGKLEKIGERFVKFFDGSPAKKDAISLYHLIKEGNDTHSAEIYDMYLDKIVAVHKMDWAAYLGNYKSAAENKKIIKVITENIAREELHRSE